MRRNPRMKVCIIGGRYDAATTWWNVVHDMSCQFLSPALKERLEWHRYGCGHMAYVDEPTLLQMGTDLAAFYAKK
jgi:carboxypeptidase C (cathepsin A)